MAVLSGHWPGLVEWLVRRRSRRADPPAAAAMPDRPATKEGLAELDERRAEALRRMFPKLYNWYASASEWRVAVDVQNYLAAASNITDLENRIRIVEQRRRFDT